MPTLGSWRRTVPRGEAPGRDSRRGVPPRELPVGVAVRERVGRRGGLELMKGLISRSEEERRAEVYLRGLLRREYRKWMSAIQAGFEAKRSREDPWRGPSE
jgi:hypothetical protein